MLPEMMLTALLSVPPAGALSVPAGAREAVLAMPDGFKVRVELALTPEAHSKGLMFRKVLKEDRGMLFVFGEPGEKSFWMKNTFVELDMVFLDKDLSASRIFHRVPPSSPGRSDEEVARASSPAFHVLELAGGTARRHGLKPGSRIKVSFPKAPKPRPVSVSTSPL